MSKDDPIRHREIFGFMHNGAKIFLDRAPMSDSAVTLLLDNVALGYNRPEGTSGSLTLSTSVFDLKAFAGIQILPGPKAQS